MPHALYHHATARLGTAGADAAAAGRAAALYRMAIAWDPADARALYLLGDALRRAGETGGGDARRRAFLTDAAALPEANVDLGEAAGGANPALALAVLFQALAQAPDPAGSPAARRARGLILGLSGCAGAVDDPGVRRRMVLFLGEQPAPHPARVAWMGGLASDAGGWADEGHACYRQGRFTAALDAFRRAAAAAPEQPACRRWLADTLFRLDRPAAAAAVAANAAVLDPADPMVWLSRGHALFAAGAIAPAADAFHRAVVLDPADSTARRCRADSLYRLDRAASAAVAAASAAALAPGDAAIWLSRGHALSAAGDVAGGAGAFRRAVMLDPADGPARRYRADALFQLGVPGLAYAAYGRALALAPEDGALWAGRGHAAPVPAAGAAAFDRARRLGVAGVDRAWVWSRFLAVAGAVRTLAPGNGAV